MQKYVFLARRAALWLMGMLVCGQLVYAQDFAELVEQNRAAVVNVSSTQKTTEADSEEEAPSLEEFFGIPRTPRESRGSGFIISADGYVLTNHHVVKDADEIYVSLVDRREFPATVVGSDELSDVALLKIEADNLPLVKIGDSDKLKVGQWVLAIGAPFGFDYSVSQGIISALGRSLPDETYVPFIQMDAALNPGNSGGPLFNLDGEVVGINSQIYTQSGGYMGLSFAIPIKVAMNAAEQLKTSGKVSRGWLGVLIQSIDSNLAKSFGLDAPRGALVSKVMPDGPAAQAGIQVGDIILEYNGKKLDQHLELPALVGQTPVGEEATLLLRRAGQEQTLKVMIAELSDDPENLGGGVAASKTRLKILVEDLSKTQRETLGAGGVVVKNVVEGPAAKAGLQNGDIILKLDHNDVRDMGHFEELVSALPSGQPIALLVQREDDTFFTTLQIPAENSQK